MPAIENQRDEKKAVLKIPALLFLWKRGGAPPKRISISNLSRKYKFYTLYRGSLALLTPPY